MKQKKIYTLILSVTILYSPFSIVAEKNEKNDIHSEKVDWENFKKGSTHEQPGQFKAGLDPQTRLTVKNTIITLKEVFEKMNKESEAWRTEIQNLREALKQEGSLLIPNSTIKKGVWGFGLLIALTGTIFSTRNVEKKKSFQEGGYTAILCSALAILMGYLMIN